MILGKSYRDNLKVLHIPYEMTKIRQQYESTISKKLKLREFCKKVIKNWINLQFSKPWR